MSVELAKQEFDSVTAKGEGAVGVKQGIDLARFQQAIGANDKGGSLKKGGRFRDVLGVCCEGGGICGWRAWRQRGGGFFTLALAILMPNLKGRVGRAGGSGRDSRQKDEGQGGKDEMTWVHDGARSSPREVGHTTAE